MRNGSYIILGAAGIALVAGAAIAHQHGYRLDWTSQLAPAWVQAIGSILAIVAAAAIAQLQHANAVRLEERKRAAADKQKLEVIMALMARSTGLANDVCKAYLSQSEEDIAQISPPLMQDTHAALMALPAFEIPGWELALDTLMISRALASLREQFLALQEHTPESAEQFQQDLADLNVLAQEVKQVSEASVAICKREIKKRKDLLVGDG